MTCLVNSILLAFILAAVLGGMEAVKSLSLAVMALFALTVALTVLAYWLNCTVTGFQLKRRLRG